jgi:nucleoside-diphosphate-sugar epimerase
MTRVLVTGATGCVGQALCTKLALQGYRVRAAVRGGSPAPPGADECAPVDDIGEQTDWSVALRGVDAVVHLAARSHIIRDSSKNAELYFRTNARGTERLAEAAAHSGVERLVFLSSVKVNGEETLSGAFSARDKPKPADAYGMSKWAAEQAIAEVMKRAGLNAVVVRSPLVYGPGVKANFLRMLRWVDRGWPLPLGAIDNRRSIVCIWNLCDLLAHAIKMPAALGGTWMVSDGEDVSTPELLRRIAHAMNRRARLIRLPIAALSWMSHLTSRGEEIQRLYGSLVVDIAETRQILGWNPSVSMNDAILQTVAWYRSERS